MQGKGKFEEIIVSSNEISASTAQLVSFVASFAISTNDTDADHLIKSIFLKKKLILSAKSKRLSCSTNLSLLLRHTICITCLHADVFSAASYWAWRGWRSW